MKPKPPGGQGSSLGSRPSGIRSNVVFSVASPAALVCPLGLKRLALAQDPSDQRLPSARLLRRQRILSDAQLALTPGPLDLGDRRLPRRAGPGNRYRPRRLGLGDRCLLSPGDGDAL